MKKSPRILSTNVTESNTPISFLKSHYSGKIKLHPYASEFEDPGRVSDYINTPKYKLFKEHLKMRLYDKDGNPKIRRNLSKEEKPNLELNIRRDSEPTPNIYTKYIDYHRERHKKTKKKETNLSLVDINKKLYRLEEEKFLYI